LQLLAANIPDLWAALGVCKEKNAKKQSFLAFFLSEMHFGKQSATNS